LAIHPKVREVSSESSAGFPKSPEVLGDLSLTRQRVLAEEKKANVYMLSACWAVLSLVLTLSWLSVIYSRSTMSRTTGNTHIHQRKFIK